MIENQKSQEIVISMLTEIYDQLEELEGVLESSLIDLRSDLFHRHSTTLAICEKKLTNIEHVICETENIKQSKKQSHPSAPQVLKIELGY